MKSLFPSAPPSCLLLSLLLAVSAPRAEQPPSPPASAAAPAEPSAPAEPEPERPPVPVLTALYPIWENTAYLLGHRRLYLGTSNAEFGLFDRAQLGTRPVDFIFRTPNVHVKARLLSRDRLDVAAHAELLVFLPGASEAFTSSNYISRLETQDILLTVIPVGATASYQVFPWLYLHGTVTAMGMFDDGPYRARVVFGTNLVAELLALQHHSIRIHMGEVGFWDHDFNLLGASYSYRRKWFEAQVGYFYRFMREGRQTNPLFALGVYL